jgi:hypothetical protein
VRAFLALACLGLAVMITAGEHEKKGEPPANRDPASLRPQAGRESRTEFDSVLDDLQASVGELNSVLKGPPPEPSRTGEGKRPAPFWSMPK